MKQIEVIWNWWKFMTLFLYGHSPMSLQIASGARSLINPSKIFFPSVLTKVLHISFWPVNCSHSWNECNITFFLFTELEEIKLSNSRQKWPKLTHLLHEVQSFLLGVVALQIFLDWFQQSITDFTANSLDFQVQFRRQRKCNANGCQKKCWKNKSSHFDACQVQLRLFDQATSL